MKKILIVFLFALSIRGAFLFVWYHLGEGPRLASDTPIYAELAQNIIDGKGFKLGEVLTARRPPLYPLFLVPFVKYHFYPLGVQIVQGILSALSCILLFGIGKELFEEKVGLLAAAIMAVDYLCVRQTTSVMPETLLVFFILGCFYCLYRTQRKETVGWLLMSGISGGLSLLTKDVLTLFFPFLLLWLICMQKSWKKGVVYAGIFALGLLLAIGPWMLRNMNLYGRPILVTTSAGHAFYLGNNPTTNPGTTGGESEFRWDTACLLDPNLPPIFSPEADSYLFKRGLDFVRTHPRRTIVMMGRKTWNMWRPAQTDSPKGIQVISTACYLPILLFGLLGMIGNIGRWKEFLPIFALVVYTVLLHAILIATIRYRFPLMPFFMLFAGTVIAGLWKKPNARIAD